MIMNNFPAKNKVLNSVKAEEGAFRLLEKIDSGELSMDLLPNKFSRFTGTLEENDYISYFFFLKSSNGKKILNMLEEEDGKDNIQL